MGDQASDFLRRDELANELVHLSSTITADGKAFRSVVNEAIKSQLDDDYKDSILKIIESKIEEEKYSTIRWVVSVGIVAFIISLLPQLFIYTVGFAYPEKIAEHLAVRLKSDDNSDIARAIREELSSIGRESHGNITIINDKYAEFYSEYSNILKVKNDINTQIINMQGDLKKFEQNIKDLNLISEKIRSANDDIESYNELKSVIDAAVAKFYVEYPEKKRQELMRWLATAISGNVAELRRVDCASNYVKIATFYLAGESVGDAAEKVFVCVSNGRPLVGRPEAIGAGSL